MIGAELPGAKFFRELFDTDEGEVRRVRAGACPWCRGRLDRADYPRKPRGLPVEVEGLFERRFSLCCSREGCRRRVTPASVRFLGRRVYVGILVVLASTVSVIAAMVAFEVARRTVQRWGRWWTQTLPGTAFWQVAKARFATPVGEAALPGALVARFHGDRETALLTTLRFIAPITTTSARSSFAMGP
jgi:hypothetical protein